MGDATVNGDMPASDFLSVSNYPNLDLGPADSFQHVSSYPVVSDGITYFKQNPVGAKSIEVTNAGYAKFVKPALPYVETPVSYAKPYVAKADELGDKFLTKVDEKVPVLKSETQEIKSSIWSLLFWPVTKTAETKDWALDTYSAEYKKCGGDGMVAGGKAAVTTPLILGSDVLQWLSSFLQAKKDEAKEIVQEKTNN